MTYAALGRDLFFNPLITNSQNDLVSENLIYLRMLAASGLVVVVLLQRGLQGSIPLVRPELLPFVVLTVASAAWTVDTKETMRAALLLTALYVALCFATRRLSVATMARLTLNIIAPVVIASALVAVFLPSIGVHSVTDAFQGSHAGRWRGIFAHKNALGPWAAYGSVLFLTHRKLLNWPKWYIGVASISAVLCLINSNSATALVGSVILLLTYFLLTFARRTRRWQFAMLLVASGVLAAVAVQYSSSALLGLIGRDETLTGRRDLWPIAISYIQSHLLLGSGFGTIGGPGFFAGTMAHFGAPLGPENGYLSLLLDLGLVGFVLFFGCVGLALWRGIPFLTSPNSEEASAASMFFMIIVTTMVMALTEATPYLCTGYIGVITYTALVGLLSLPGTPRRLRLRPSTSTPVEAL